MTLNATEHTFHIERTIVPQHLPLQNTLPTLIGLHDDRCITYNAPVEGHTPVSHCQQSPSGRPSRCRSPSTSGLLAFIYLHPGGTNEAGVGRVGWAQGMPWRHSLTIIADTRQPIDSRQSLPAESPSLPTGQCQPANSQSSPAGHCQPVARGSVPEGQPIIDHRQQSQPQSGIANHSQMVGQSPQDHSSSQQSLQTYPGEKLLIIARERCSPSQDTRERRTPYRITAVQQPFPVQQSCPVHHHSHSKFPYARNIPPSFHLTRKLVRQSYAARRAYRLS